MTFNRIVVVAPTRSTCVNLHHLVGLDDVPETLLIRECGQQLDLAIADLPNGGFGVVAGTGSGKSVAIRKIATTLLDDELRVGIVTQEHAGGRNIRGKNVVVITPGVAVEWAKAGTLSQHDLVVLDEVHQTSEHLELAMALLKRAGATFVWMSATIDPSVYQEYLEARTVIECNVYDESRRADVNYHSGSAQKFLRENIAAFAGGKRGVAMFVPTRSEAESLAKEFDGTNGVHVNFYHGGEPAEKLRAFIEGTIERPYVIAMTSAGASSLNIAGLDTVVIVDKQFKEVVSDGKRRLASVELDPNTLLQMAGRVDGRAIGGQVHIITTNHQLDLRQTDPVTPSFMLGGNLELLALTTARAGVDVEQLELIGEVDQMAYERVFARLVRRDLIAVDSGQPSLTNLGEKIERLPLDAAWGEVVVKAQAAGNDNLFNLIALTACCSDLHSMTIRGKWLKYSDLVVQGSDHLTVHNIVAEALRQFGKIKAGKYRIDDKQFSKWCEENGYSRKEILNVALMLGSLYDRMGMQLPDPSVAFAAVTSRDILHTLFIEVLAMVQSMDYVRYQQHSSGVVFGNDRNGVSRGQSVLGTIRHWRDKRGMARATIEGTEIPEEVVLRNAERRFDRFQTSWTGATTAVFNMVFAEEFFGYSEATPIDDISSLAPELQDEWSWRNWRDKPRLVAPSIDDLNAPLPEMVVHSYGISAVTGEPLFVYGVFRSHRGYYGVELDAEWTRNIEQARIIHEQTIDLIEYHRNELRDQTVDVSALASKFNSYR